MNTIHVSLPAYELPQLYAPVAHFVFGSAAMTYFVCILSIVLGLIIAIFGSRIKSEHDGLNFSQIATFIIGISFVCLGLGNVPISLAGDGDIASPSVYTDSALAKHVETENGLISFLSSESVEKVMWAQKGNKVIADKEGNPVTLPVFSVNQAKAVNQELAKRFNAKAVDGSKLVLTDGTNATLTSKNLYDVNGQKTSCAVSISNPRKDALGHYVSFDVANLYCLSKTSQIVTVSRS